MRSRILVLALLLSGCHSVSSLQAKHIADAAASSQADFKTWNQMSDDQKLHAHWLLSRAIADTDKEVNGQPLPDIFQTDPWAPVVTPITSVANVTSK